MVMDAPPSDAASSDAGPAAAAAAMAAARAVSNRRVSPFLLNPAGSASGKELPAGLRSGGLELGPEASASSGQICEAEMRDKVGSRLHDFTRAHFSQGLRVHSIQERASQYQEHWAHTDDTGAFHYPLASPQISSVRSLQDHVRAPTASTPAAKAVRATEDHWYNAPPSTPAIKNIRSMQEDAWAQPTQKPTVAQVRSLQEEFFPGINDIASAALAAVNNPPTITPELLATATGPEAARAYRRSSSICAPASLLHSPLLSVCSDAASGPHITVLRQAEDRSSHDTVSHNGAHASAHTAATPLPASALGAATSMGASIWGACAGAVQEQLGSSGSSGVCGPEDASAVSSVLARAAVLAAMRRAQEDTFVTIKSTPAIETIREDEEVKFKAPANTPQVQQVRRAVSDFRSMPTSPAVQQVRAAQEGFRSPGADATSSHMIAMLRAGLDDPFGAGAAATPGASRQSSTPGVAKHCSLPHPTHVAAGRA